MCQSLSRAPDNKYQNEGGPAASEIFELIREKSSKPLEDVTRFLDAMIYHWFIGGTDAHAKNFGFLIAGDNQVRLAPLYDTASSLPYPIDTPIQKAKLAMKIGGRYHLNEIGKEQWEKASSEWNISPDEIIERITALAKKIPNAASAISSEITASQNANSQFIEELGDKISKRSQLLLQNF